MSARTAPLDPHVFLVGRPPMGEYIGFVRGSLMDGGGKLPADSALADDWRTANDHLRELERIEGGLADRPPMADPTGEALECARRLLSAPRFPQIHGATPTRIAMVELDRLVVYQKCLNLAHVDIIKEELGSQPSEGTVARVALGLDRYCPPVRLMRNQDVFTFVCDSKDLRFIEPMTLAPESFPAAARGVPAHCIAFAVGFSQNCLGAIHFEDRLVLFNGSHRAYAFRDLGITHVPCLIQEISRREEIDLVAHRELSQRSDLYLKSPRPPLLKDYFDPRLRRIVPVVRSNRLIRVQLRVDQSDIPGA